MENLYKKVIGFIVFLFTFNWKITNKQKPTSVLLGIDQQHLKLRLTRNSTKQKRWLIFPRECLVCDNAI